LPTKYSNIPVKFAESYANIWIQLFQQFTGILQQIKRDNLS